MGPEDADGMANSVVQDQTEPDRSSLIWVYTVCSGLYVRKFKNITVIWIFHRVMQLNNADRMAEYRHWSDS